LSILEEIEKARVLGHTLLAQLIDPDFIGGIDHLIDVVQSGEKAGVDFFFYGGSLIEKSQEADFLKVIKEISKVPTVIFPSSPNQINENADGILFLSLISGRNPEFLIGNQILAAPLLQKSKLEILPTGYMLISCGEKTTAEYISNTASIPYGKDGIAATTALAGQYLGLKLIYLDGGSGADKTVSPKMVERVKSAIDIPLIVGGGIRSVEDAVKLSNAGADLLVVGNAAEKNPNFIPELCEKMK
jgi:putative glycerol-1-phosphate prenyltransferase